jgi:hypothetical protein
MNLEQLALTFHFALALEPVLSESAFVLREDQVQTVQLYLLSECAQCQVMLAFATRHMDRRVCLRNDGFVPS